MTVGEGTPAFPCDSRPQNVPEKRLAFVAAVMVQTRQLAEEDRPLGEVLLNWKLAFGRP
jgi:hypothetical protein